MSKFTVHHSAKVLTGKYENLVGTVTKSNDETQKVELLFDGVINDKPVTMKKWFTYSQVEAM